MATLLTSDLPSSDDEDIEFAPQSTDFPAQTTPSLKAGKRKAAPASTVTVASQAAYGQSSKRVSTATAWEQLKSAQPSRRLKECSAFSLGSLCAPVSRQRGAVAGQDWMTQLGIQQQQQPARPLSDECRSQKAADRASPATPSSRAAAAAALAKAGPDTSEAATEVRRFAGKDVQVSQSSVDESAEERRQRGLDDVLQSLAVVRDVNTLDKSRSDWRTHKQLNPEEAAELEKYKRSNNKFLDRQDFLKRAIVREYEQERNERLAGDMRTRGRL